MIGFYNSMVGERIGEIIQRGQAPYVKALVGFFGMVKGYYAYSVSATAKPNQEREALVGALEEHERIFQHGFTEDELKPCESQYADQPRIHGERQGQNIQ